MITQNQIKYIKSLHQSKFRQKYNKFIAEGDKIAQEILKNSIYKTELLIATEQWINTNPDLAREHQNILIGIDKKEMNKISALKTPTNVLIVLEKLPQSINYKLMNSGNVIYLDEVQDPGNVGTIIRIADWFGMKAVIRSKGSADFYNPKVIQATMGSFINVGLYTEDYQDIKLAEHKSVGAAMMGKDIKSFDWPSKSIVVMGNEGRGIQASVYQQLDHIISIKGASQRVAESLNVSVATGIICSHLNTN